MCVRSMPRSPISRRAVAFALAGALLAACDEPPTGGRSGPGGSAGGLSLLFKQPVEGAWEAWVPTSDGIRLYADVDRRIEAFALGDGRRVWSYIRPPGGPSALVVEGGRLFFAGTEAVALDAATGTELWRRPLDAHAGFCESDGTADAFYTGTEDLVLHAFRAADGTELWTRRLGEDWPHGGVVRGLTVSGDTLYAAVEHHTGVNGHIGTGDLFALDRHTGEILWVHRNGDGNGLDIYQSAPRVAGQLLLLNANWTNEYPTLDRFRGTEVWRYRAVDPYAGMQEAPEVSGSVAYLTSQDGYAVALDLETGRPRWRTQLDGGANWIAVCGARVLVGDHGITVLDHDGRILGTRHASWAGDVLHTDFVVVGDRAYLFGVQHLYAFRCPT